MKSFFKVVRKVLDELYDAVPEEDRDDLIKEAIENTGLQYKNIIAAAGPDFSNPATRFGYVYRYTTAHADMMHELIRDSDALKDHFKKDHMRVSCLGGGPGSELLGFCRYALSRPKKPSMSFHLLDKEATWSEAWSDVDLIMSQEKELTASKTFVPLDVSDKSDWAKYTKPLQADVFTSIYFLSEIYKQKTKARPFFKNLVKSAKSGAAIAVLDFNHSDIKNFSDEIFDGDGIDIETTYETTFQISSGEDKEELGPYLKKFGYPKLSSKIFARVYTKL